MKTMKFLMMVAMLIVSMTVVGQGKGQRQADPKVMAAKKSERMKASLSLTEDQFTKVSQANERFAIRRSEIRQDSAMAQGAARAEMKSLFQTHQSELKEILTEEQWAKWSAMRAERMEANKNKKGNGNKRGPAAP